MTITRRQLFRGLTATSLIALLPSRLRAEPITIGAAISAAMAVIGAIQEANSQAALRRNLANINAKLDTLILGQQEILNEIARLRLFISAELFTQFRQEAERTMFALKDRYDFLLVGGFNARTEPDFRLLSANVQDATNRLGFYDFGAFVTFMTGAAMSLVLRRIVPTTPDQFARLRSGFKAKLDEWLNAQNVRGVVKAIELARAEVAAAETDLANYPREFTLRRYSEIGSDDICEYEELLNLTGDLNQPFSASTTTRETRCRRRPGGIHDGPRSGQFGAQVDIPAISGSPDYSGIPSPAASNDSQYDQVNQANRIRNELIARMRRVRDLEFIKGLIERASASLA